MDKAANHLAKASPLYNPSLLPFTSPLAWDHIILSGNFDWHSGATERKAANRAGFVHPTVQRYGERTAVERVNGRLKDEFRAHHLRMRGHQKVQAHLMFGIVVLCIDQITLDSAVGSKQDLSKLLMLER